MPAGGTLGPSPGWGLAAMNQTIEMLKRLEAFEAQPYRDKLGYWTVGYGHNLHTTPLTEQQAHDVLVGDIERVVNEVSQWRVWGTLDEVRRSALVQMAFQMGTAGLAKFVATLGKLETGDYQGAARNVLRSLWAKQTPKRARLVARMIETGTWPDPSSDGDAAFLLGDDFRVT